MDKKGKKLLPIYFFYVNFGRNNKIYNITTNNTFMKTITFNELRKIKDSLPDGSMHRIADELNMSVETVRNFFGGSNFKQGESVGIHLEPGPDGGLVMLDDTTVLDKALEILKESQPEEANSEETSEEA